MLRPSMLSSVTDLQCKVSPIHCHKPHHCHKPSRARHCSPWPWCVVLPVHPLGSLMGLPSKPQEAGFQCSTTSVPEQGCATSSVKINLTFKSTGPGALNGPETGPIKWL